MPTASTAKLDQDIARLERRLARLRSESSRTDRAIDTRAAVIVGATINAHAPASFQALVRKLLERHARPQDLEALERAGWHWALPQQAKETQP